MLPMFGHDRIGPKVSRLVHKKLVSNLSNLLAGFKVKALEANQI